jgi:hypothetical protein
MFIKILLWIKWQLCAFVGWYGKIFRNLQSPSFGRRTYEVEQKHRHSMLRAVGVTRQAGRQAHVSCRKFRINWLCCVKLCINVNVNTVVNWKISTLAKGPGETDSRSASQTIPLLKKAKGLQSPRDLASAAFLGQKNSIGYTVYLTYLRTYLLTYLRTYLRTYWHTYLLTYLLTYLHIYLLTYLLTYLLIYILTYLCTYLIT